LLGTCRSEIIFSPQRRKEGKVTKGNNKSHNTHQKWFGQLTILSQVEGQIQMNQNPKQLTG
jgi:hypothetical protein